VALIFPNASRSYDARRQQVRFWGYDSALEISFFVETAALRKLRPQTGDAQTGNAQTGDVEAGYLEAFDGAREQILDAARKAYTRGRHDAYLLAAADF
jgi:hypothetical protein